MKYEVKNNKLVLFFKGHVDSGNASELEHEAFDIIKGNEFEDISIDMEKLEYISSAGLRIILRIRKSYPSLSIVNVHSSVYEILEMTGFTEMMKVVKALRRVTVDKSQRIAEGSNGVVYRLDKDTIIKVYRNPDSLPDIEREMRLARHALIQGIPTAIAYDVVKVDESYGSVFELLNSIFNK